MSKDKKYEYDPFKYPPDMQLARLHTRCSEPGDYNPEGDICPCCNVQEKKLVTNWAGRSISEDFKQNGAVLAYFSLMKFYCATILIVIGIYSCYQMYCLQYICSKTEREQNQCVQVYGVWIISNMDLANIMKNGDEGKLTILLILRSVTFLLLIMANMFSLVVASRTRNIIIDVSSYSLFFKNIPPQWRQKELTEAIKAIDSEIEIKDIIFFKKTSSYAQAYNTKINTYFALKDDELKPRKRAKLQQVLLKSSQEVEQTTKNIEVITPRAVVVFNHLEQRAQVHRKYSLTLIHEVLMKIKVAQQKMYVTSAPLLQDIIWENIGEQSRGKTKMKLITFLIMTAILGISYVVLHFGMIMADKQDKKYINVSQKSWSTFIALVVVALAIVFRVFMNKLADMRKPNTKTSRTLFIVSTTVVYHLIYFLIVPTFYFVVADQDRSRKLFSISYQALNFIIVQLLIAGFDIFYCCWDKGRTKILGKGSKGLCQKELHKVLTSPRFAMEFKLIIIFKSWSFVTFYGFEVPYVLVLLFFSMLFIFIMDKRHVYIHYRLELIQAKVEYNFLKIYSNFFTVFICMIFLLTQNLTYEIYIALGISILAIVFQVLYTSKRPQISIEDNKSLDQYSPNTSYRSKYQQFLESLHNPQVDKAVDDYATTMRSQISMSSDAVKESQEKLIQ